MKLEIKTHGFGFRQETKVHNWPVFFKAALKKLVSLLRPLCQKMIAWSLTVCFKACFDQMRLSLAASVKPCIVIVFYGVLDLHFILHRLCQYFSSSLKLKLKCISLHQL